MICTKTSPYHAVQQAIDDATLMCTRGYGDSSDWDMDSIRSEKMLQINFPANRLRTIMGKNKRFKYS